MSSNLHQSKEAQNSAVFVQLSRSVDKIFIISCVFLALIFGLFLWNQIKLTDTDPQSNLHIEAMVEQLQESPKDAHLKLNIRNTDRKIRQEYFIRLRLAEKGKYVLGFAIALALISAASALAVKTKSLAMPSGALDSPRLPNKATLGSAVVLVLIFALLIAFAFKKPTDLSGEYFAVIAADTQKSSDDTGAEAKIISPPASQAAGVPTVPPQMASPGLVVPVLPVSPESVGAVQPSEGSSEEFGSEAADSGMGMMGSMPPMASVDTGPQLKLPDITLSAYDPTDHTPSLQNWNANWPVFRGPYGNGVIEDVGYPTKWDAAKGDNLIWKAEVSLPGWNSPVVWGDRVFITGADENRRAIYCYSAADGKLLWSDKLNSIDPATEKPQIMEDTGYAPSTCATDGKRVFSMFPNGDIFCHDYNGKQLWSKALGLPLNMYGHASSLALYKNILIVQMDQDSSGDSDLSALYGLQAKDGAYIWRTIRPVPNSWTSPLVMMGQRRDMIITSASPWAIAYEPLTGKEIWRAKAANGDVAPSLALAGNKVFITNTGSYLFAIDITGAADVTATNIVWKMYENLPDISSPVANTQYVFMSTTDGIFTCVDAKDGKVIYEHMLDVTVNASPIIVGKRIYLLDAQGVMHVISLGNKFKEESKGIVPDRTLATPAFAKGRIYIRGNKTLFCIGAKK